ncbi:hypothetical protein ACMA5I_15360 [Paracoccaceae bacterium GXU_MW_L88]
MSKKTPEKAQDGALLPTSKSRHRSPLPSDRYGISRKSARGVDGKAWIVKLSRGGRMIQASFTDGTYGGREVALYVARAYRDAVLEVIPPLTKAEMRQVQRRKAEGSHSSEITGVHYAKPSKGRSAAWVARIELPAEEGTTSTAKRQRRAITRRFSVARLGYDAAKAAAEEARLEMLDALQDGQDPALRSGAAQRLHKRLSERPKGEERWRSEPQDTAL